MTHVAESSLLSGKNPITFFSAGSKITENLFCPTVLTRINSIPLSWLAVRWGHSVLVTEQGVERLSRHPLDLVELD